MRFLSEPWPWYVAGPLIGLVVPGLLILGNRLFGVSSNLRHICAVTVPGRIAYFRYDWRSAGLWNLVFVVGVAAGGFLGAVVFRNPEPVQLSSKTAGALAALGIHDLSGLAPRELFNWGALLSLRGILLIVVGGFLVGFGTAWAGGCTSGHGIAGLADRQLPSLVAVAGFFAGGLVTTHLLLPLLLAR